MPIRDDSEKVNTVLCIARDITEAKYLERQLVNTEKLAALGTLAAGVAHEINNPLWVILGFCDMLVRKKEKRTQEFEDLKTIERQGYHCKKIVENLLRFARHGEQTSTYSNVNQCLNEVTGIVAHTMEINDIALIVELNAHIPPVRGDHRELQQVFLNLINNAKPFERKRILLTIDKVMSWQKMLAENITLHKALSEKEGTPPMIGATPPMKKLFEKIKQVAPTTATVLITGESGTGKELVAKAIHHNSRKEDIPLLARYFLKKYALLNQKDILDFTPDAICALLSQSFPGNIRELENLIERSIIFSIDKLLGQKDLFPDNAPDIICPEISRDIMDLPFRDAKEKMIQLFHSQYIRMLLENSNGNISRAADATGIQRQYLHRLIKEAGINAEAYKSKIGGG